MPNRKLSFQSPVQRLCFTESAAGEDAVCPAIVSQAVGDHVTTAGTSTRLHRAARNPMLSEDAWLVSNPSMQFASLTTPSESPVQVRFTMNFQRSQMKS